MSKISEIYTLLRAEMGSMVISWLLGVACSTVYEAKKAMNWGEGPEDYWKKRTDLAPFD